MKLTDPNTILVNSYLHILEKLNPACQLDIISKLSESLKNRNKSSKNSFVKAFGSWDKAENAEELIRTIRKSRKFNRKTEAL